MAEVGTSTAPRPPTMRGPPAATEAGHRRLHVRGQVAARPARRGSGSAGRWPTPTSCSRSAWASRSRRSSIARARRPSATARSRLVLELLGRAGPGGRAARRRGRRERGGPRRARRPRRRVRGGGRRHGLGTRVAGTRAARWRATASASRDCTPPGARCTSRWPRAVLADRRREDARRSSTRWRRHRPERRMIWAAAGLPGMGGAPACSTRRASCWPTAGAASWSPTSACWSCYGERLAGLAAATLDRAVRRAAQDACAEAERLLRELARAGMQRSDTIVALGGGVAGDLAGFCAATYQRGVAVVHVPDDARGTGRLRLRRQDRRRPAGGARTTSARSTSPPRCSPIPRCSATLPRAGAERRLRRGREDGADRGRAPVGRRARAGAAAERGREPTADTLTAVIEACARTKLSVVARGRARHRRAGRAQPRAHVRARARVGRPATGGTATARPSRSACSSRCGFRSASPGSTRRCASDVVRAAGAAGPAAAVRRTAGRRSCSSTWAATRSGAAPPQPRAAARARATS